jgi:hypothetical protein
VSTPVSPEIDLGELISNASADAFEWLCDAVDRIDGKMGHGYAAKNPSLVVGFMHAAAISYLAERTVDAARGISLALEQIQPDAEARMLARAVHGFDSDKNV